MAPARWRWRLSCQPVRPNFWFVFYAERLDRTWIMTSAEFDQLAVKNKTGKNIGLRSIWFNGKRKCATTGATEEYCKPP